VDSAIRSHRVTLRPILAQALSASSDVLICALCTSEGRGSLDSSWQCPCTMVSISGSRDPEEVRDGRSRSDPWALPVSNLNASIAFYTTYARMQVVHRRTVPTTGLEVAWLSDQTRPFVIVLAERSQVDHPLVPPAHLGVACESREEVEQLCALARGEGRLLNGPRDAGPPIRVCGLHPRSRRPYPEGVVWPGSRSDHPARHRTPLRRTRHAAPLSVVRAAPEHFPIGTQ
jgi:hypothetical protein